MAEYWAYTWLDSRRIATVNDLKRELASAGVVSELKESADLVIKSWRSGRIEARPLSLIAGAGIDLSGRLDCNATECRRAQVERLFRRAWLYFPTIVARDAIVQDLVVHRDCPDAELQSLLLPHFETVMMIRELGVEALVEFLPRVPPCFAHWREHANEAGIGDLAERSAEIANQLLGETRIDLDRNDDGILCTLNNPVFAHTQWVPFDLEDIRDRTEDQIKRLAIEHVIRLFMVNLSADVNAAKQYGGALGSTLPFYQRLLDNRGRRVNPVAFEVGLPALDFLSIGQLIEVRDTYSDSFIRFRGRVTAFLDKCVRQGISEPADIQVQLKAELIDKELEDLRASLNRAGEALKRKAAYAVGLASLVATVGVTTGIITPPVAFGLTATVSAASLSPGVSKYIDDKTNIESSDMYFLLQAESHQH